MDVLQQWREYWFETSGRAQIADAVRTTLQQHHDQGDTVVIISASNRFCVEPFARELGAHDFLASVPEIVDNRFTGAFLPPPCFSEGKIHPLENWMTGREHSLEGSYFYSDSRNDIPLLLHVDNPVAVNPDSHLTQVAGERGWPQLNLR